MSADPDERRKKLEELRRKKEAREKQTNTIIDQILSEPARPAEEVKEQTSSPTRTTEEIQTSQPAKKKVDIKIQHFVGEITYQAKEKVETYSQEIQVDLIDTESTNQTGSMGRVARIGSVGKKDKELDDSPDQMNLPQKHTERRMTKHGLEDKGVGDNKQQGDDAKAEMAPEEVKNLVKSKDFVDFFMRSSKLIEKALDSKNVDLFEDILMNDSGEQYQDRATKKDFQEIHTFTDQQLASNRVVTSIDWSPNLPDLFLSSYSQSFEGNPNDPQGVVLLWSLSLRSRPEFTCYCQSQVTVAKFNQYSNSTIIGGTYSGQIVIWDLRVKSTPVQRSGMASGGHAHPVYSLSIVGTQNSHNIVSVSNDGKLCVWNTSMLTQPQKEIDLKYKQPGEARAPGEGNVPDVINTTCMCFPHEEANNFYAGVEDGTIYLAQVHGNQANENVIEAFSGHQAPITGLSVMPYNTDMSSDVSNLLLSSSYDWTVKLWNPKSRNQHLWSFESAEDYIYDVAWNPVNPTLFSTVDGEGYVDLWDLSKDFEVPHLHIKGDTRALSKLSWAKDGSKMLTGSSDGNLKLYGLHKNLLKPTEEAMDKFATQIYKS